MGAPASFPGNFHHRLIFRPSVNAISMLGHLHPSPCITASFPCQATSVPSMHHSLIPMPSHLCPSPCITASFPCQATSVPVHASQPHSQTTELNGVGTKVMAYLDIDFTHTHTHTPFPGLVERKRQWAAQQLARDHERKKTMELEESLQSAAKHKGIPREVGWVVTSLCFLLTFAHKFIIILSPPPPPSPLTPHTHTH